MARSGKSMNKITCPRRMEFIAKMESIIVNGTARKSMNKQTCLMRMKFLARRESIIANGVAMEYMMKAKILAVLPTTRIANPKVKK